MIERNLILSQSDFDRFADVSGDRNPIHVDPAFARRTRFDGTVAHGMLLFAVAVAELRRSNPSTRTTAADLVFSAPTYARRTHVMTLDRTDEVATVRIETEEGIETAAVTLWLGEDPGGYPVSEETAERLGPLSLGDTATITRTFSDRDNRALADLVDDPGDPEADLSPVLVGGLVSNLLGMRVPGPGTNWLKQRYRFTRRIPVDSTVTAEVRIVRLRPEKDLVDLTCRATVDDEPVMSGRSLVYVADVDPD